VTAGTAATHGGALVASVLAARLLGQDSFGQFGLLRSTLLLLAVFAGASLGLAATKRIAELRGTDPARAERMIHLLLQLAMGAGLIVAAAGALLARPLAETLLGSPELSVAFQLGCAYLAGTVVAGVQNGALAGLEQFSRLARLQALEAGLQLAGLALGASLWELTGAIGGLAVAVLLMVPLRQLAVRRAVRQAGLAGGKTSGAATQAVNAPFRETLRTEGPLLRHFALPAALLGLAVQPFEWWVRLGVAGGPGGFGELGLFAAAFALSQAVQFLPQQLAQPALPVLTAEWQNGDLRAVRRLMWQLLAMFTGAAALVAAVLVIFGGPLLRLYGPAFADGTLTLGILAGAYVLAAAARVFSLVLVAGGQMWLQTGHSLCWSLVLTGTFLISPRQDAAALAVCYATAFGAFLLMQARAARRVLRECERKQRTLTTPCSTP
jgi:O-antigen/teichoic acid export membrane protein